MPINSTEGFEGGRNNQSTGQNPELIRNQINQMKQVGAIPDDIADILVQPDNINNPLLDQLLSEIDGDESIIVNSSDIKSACQLFGGDPNNSSDILKAYIIATNIRRIPPGNIPFIPQNVLYNPDNQSVDADLYADTGTINLLIRSSDNLKSKFRFPGENVVSFRPPLVESAFWTAKERAKWFNKTVSENTLLWDRLKQQAQGSGVIEQEMPFMSLGNDRTIVLQIDLEDFPDYEGFRGSIFMVRTNNNNNEYIQVGNLSFRIDSKDDVNTLIIGALQSTEHQNNATKRIASQIRNLIRDPNANIFGSEEIELGITGLISLLKKSGLIDESTSVHFTPPEQIHWLDPDSYFNLEIRKKIAEENPDIDISTYGFPLGSDHNIEIMASYIGITAENLQEIQTRARAYALKIGLKTEEEINQTIIKFLAMESLQFREGAKSYPGGRMAIYPGIANYDSPTSPRDIYKNTITRAIQNEIKKIRGQYKGNNKLTKAKLEELVTFMNAHYADEMDKPLRIVDIIDPDDNDDSSSTDPSDPQPGSPPPSPPPESPNDSSNPQNTGSPNEEDDQKDNPETPKINQQDRPPDQPQQRKSAQAILHETPIQEEQKKNWWNPLSKGQKKVTLGEQNEQIKQAALQKIAKKNGLNKNASTDEIKKAIQEKIYNNLQNTKGALTESTESMDMRRSKVLPQKVRRGWKIWETQKQIEEKRRQVEQKRREIDTQRQKNMQQKEQLEHGQKQAQSTGLNDVFILDIIRGPLIDQIGIAEYKKMQDEMQKAADDYEQGHIDERTLQEEFKEVLERYGIPDFITQENYREILIEEFAETIVLPMAHLESQLLHDAQNALESTHALNQQLETPAEKTKRIVKMSIVNGGVIAGNIAVVCAYAGFQTAKIIAGIAGGILNSAGEDMHTLFVEPVDELVATNEAHQEADAQSDDQWIKDQTDTIYNNNFGWFDRDDARNIAENALHQAGGDRSTAQQLIQDTVENGRREQWIERISSGAGLNRDDTQKIIDSGVDGADAINAVRNRAKEQKYQSDTSESAERNSAISNAMNEISIPPSVEDAAKKIYRKYADGNGHLNTKDAARKAQEELRREIDNFEIQPQPETDKVSHTEFEPERETKAYNKETNYEEGLEGEADTVDIKNQQQMVEEQVEKPPSSQFVPQEEIGDTQWDLPPSWKTQDNHVTQQKIDDTATVKGTYGGMATSSPDIGGIPIMPQGYKSIITPIRPNPNKLAVEVHASLDIIERTMDDNPAEALRIAENMLSWADGLSKNGLEESAVRSLQQQAEVAIAEAHKRLNKI